MTHYQGARLSAYLSGQKVRVVCIRCKLQQQYDGTAMVSRVSPWISLPDPLTRIAVGLGCDLNIAPTPTAFVALCTMSSLGKGLWGAAVGSPPDVFGVEHIRDHISDQMRAVSPVVPPGAALGLTGRGVFGWPCARLAVYAERDR